MVKVKLRGMSHLTDGETELEIQSSNITITEILEKLREKYPQFKAKMFDPKTGRIYPEILIILNGRLINDYTVKLKNDDEVELLPVFAGG